VAQVAKLVERPLMAADGNGEQLRRGFPAWEGGATFYRRVCEERKLEAWPQRDVLAGRGPRRRRVRLPVGWGQGVGLARLGVARGVECYPRGISSGGGVWGTGARILAVQATEEGPDAEAGRRRVAARGCGSLGAGARHGVMLLVHNSTQLSLTGPNS
jgi:hypothetical protein